MKSYVFKDWQNWVPASQEADQEAVRQADKKKQLTDRQPGRRADCEGLNTILP